MITSRVYVTKEGIYFLPTVEDSKENKNSIAKIKLKEAILAVKQRKKEERIRANNARRVTIDGKQVRPRKRGNQ